MIIELNSVLPFPLAEYPHGKDSVWKSNSTVDSSKKTLLNASSGKGKSTFASTLYGIRQDYEGTIKIDGEDIKSFDLNEWIELRRMKLSAVFQDLQLFGDLTAFENLQLKNNLTNHRSEERMLEMLDTLGIGDKRDQTCKTMSLGQQQRVAIIRSLLQPFELLILDEPFSHLDEENSRIALNLINEETDANKAGYVLTTLGSHHGFDFDVELKL
ncbi:MAG: ATP-binding cassette domain-containing protein [Crocinitomicaceae bacterium]|nr:ATP-binding cassette domain-containing protein [Crocinitomicaceae bacterium]